MLGKTEGIVLRTHEYGEGNKILIVFTKEMGKVGLMAAGARKTKSRFSAISQPIVHAHFLFHVSSGLCSLSQAESISIYPYIRKDLYKTAAATYVLELVDRFSEDRQQNQPFYYLLRQTLTMFEQGKDVDVLTRIFELKLLASQGVTPVLHTCVSCQRERSPWFFSPREGGLLCGMCRGKDTNAFLISDATARLLHILATVRLENLGQIHVRQETKQQLQRVRYPCMAEHLGIVFKSRKFLDQLSRLEQQIPKENATDGTT